MKTLMSVDDFCNIVKAKLDTKTPFSFVRFSDGEIMLLNRGQYQATYDRAIMKLMGRAYTDQEKIELSEYLKEALRAADVVGFPTERHLTQKDYFSDGITVFKKHVMEGHPHMKKVKFASVDVGYNMVYTSRHAGEGTNHYKELMSGNDTVNYISCRNLDEQFKRVYRIKNVNSFIIAPEPKFTSGYEGESHYPDQFLKIKEWIKTVPCKGNLCLVGGGVISKIYNKWFKEQGGISLDIGAVFDLWAGYATRGKDRGLDKQFNEYKL